MSSIHSANRFLTVLASCIFATSAATAANFGVNLIANGDFEAVNLAQSGQENGPRLLDCFGRFAYAYSHDGSSSITGVVPDYAQGPNPPNAGHWYFASNNTLGADITSPMQFYQDIFVGGR